MGLVHGGHPSSRRLDHRHGDQVRRQYPEMLRHKLEHHPLLSRLGRGIQFPNDDIVCYRIRDRSRCNVDVQSGRFRAEKQRRHFGAFDSRYAYTTLASSILIICVFHDIVRSSNLLGLSQGKVGPVVDSGFHGSTTGDSLRKKRRGGGNTNNVLFVC